jgi:hypothetical protein
MSDPNDSTSTEWRSISPNFIEFYAKVRKDSSYSAGSWQAFHDFSLERRRSIELADAS